ncbi:MAG: hypothetical protein AAB353_07465 [Candidatus Hydrogenedentota bacterium]
MRTPRRPDETGRRGVFVFGAACALVLISATVTGCKRDARSAGPSAIELRTADGWTLPALHWIGAQPRTCAALLHDRGGECGDWAWFAPRLAHAGYDSLALTLRGHAGATNRDGVEARPETMSPDEWGKLDRDLEAGLAYEARAGCEGAIVIAAGIAAEAAIRVAATGGKIAALVLISPLFAEDASDIEKLVADFNQVPILLLVGDQDSAAVDAAGLINKGAGGFRELHAYPSAAHGIDLLSESRSAQEQLFQWLETVAPAATGTV